MLCLEFLDGGQVLRQGWVLLLRVCFRLLEHRQNSLFLVVDIIFLVVAGQYLFDSFGTNFLNCAESQHQTSKFLANFFQILGKSRFWLSQHHFFDLFFNYFVSLLQQPLQIIKANAEMMQFSQHFIDFNSFTYYRRLQF